jgi:hypothetical protein
VLAGVSVVALCAAVGLAAAGLAGSGGDDSVVLQVTDVAGPVPSTVAPVGDRAVKSSTTVAPSAKPDTDGPPSIPTISTTIPELPELSELATLVGPTYSAIPVVTEPRPQPVGIEIDAIDVSRFPIRAIGLEPDGQLEIPDETEIGWYRYGSSPGREGATVLAAHVSWNRTVGPFGSLGVLEPGNRIAVQLDDGTVRQYEVYERALYGKLELPQERIWTNSGPETLVLITCGGDFNPTIRRYADNIVVYAAPVG